jgi:hypothetical protein
MDDSIRPIDPRELICRDAEAAAQRFFATGVEQPNPYQGEPDEGRWAAHFKRVCQQHDEGETAA